MLARCHGCNKSTLAITHVLDLGPDDRSDEVCLQIMRCSSCKAAAIAVYEESRRGSDSSWHHDAWPATDEVVGALETLMTACPSERNVRCTCGSHAALANDAYRKFLTGTSFRVTND